MPELDYLKYAKLARQAAAEGIVLLENRNNTLPLEKNSRIALLGRVQFDTLYSGTGSGGLVHKPYKVSINEALEKDFILESKSQADYKKWLKTNPPTKGLGWALDPFSQKEMPITRRQMAAYAANTDTCIWVIGRISGEDKDQAAIEGSYYLSKEERRLLFLAREFFPKLIVVINAGNIIDNSWVKELQPDAFLYLWQGGVETGNALLDVITGDVNPSGHLPDTISFNLKDQPAHANYGGIRRNFYQEDIYVGYRYFETFKRDAVLYPFGYGLSYTDFSLKNSKLNYDGQKLNVTTTVKNVGTRAGKAVVQIYLEAPQGKLGKPRKVLLDFQKTALLAEHASQELNFSIDRYTFASFDDSGASQAKNSYVLEAGEYKVYLGFNVREAEYFASFFIEKLEVVAALTEVLAPITKFKRLRPGAKLNCCKYAETFEKVPLKTVAADFYQQKNQKDLETVAYNPEANFAFSHYKDADTQVEAARLDEYLSQFSNQELVKLARGLGMSPEGVQPGIAAAFGGVSKKSRETGMPLVGTADGPSGIRMDDGTMAFQVPVGTALAASFNPELNEELFVYLGLEMRKHEIEFLLGPGMNIHRYPLCGRNFEYFSEDPLLTGKIAIAQVQGLAKVQAFAVVKHFAANNQEFHRHDVDSIVSQRALREIYLKPFELVVKNTDLQAVMTAYNPLNGVYTASNYELDTQILRQEWGFKGVVMTDWWARMSWGTSRPASRRNIGAMIKAGNDINMPNISAENNSKMDFGYRDLRQGKINRAELIRNSKNICRVLKRVYHAYNPLELIVLNEPTLERIVKAELDLGVIGDKGRISLRDYAAEKDTCLNLKFKVETSGVYYFKLRARSHSYDAAQQNVSININDEVKCFLNLRGSQTGDAEVKFTAHNNENLISIYSAEGGLELISAVFVAEKIHNYFKGINVSKAEIDAWLSGDESMAAKFNMRIDNLVAKDIKLMKNQARTKNKRKKKYIAKHTKIIYGVLLVLLLLILFLLFYFLH